MNTSLVARLVAVVAGLSLLLGASWAVAKPPCSVKTLHGDYGYVVTGTNVGAGPVAAVGVVTADGVGGLTAFDTISVNGLVLKRTITGSYTTNANCTGTVSFTDNFGQTTNADYVLVQERSEFNLIQTDAGAVTTGIGRKQ
jgi:hypothetical protein